MNRNRILFAVLALAALGVAARQDTFVLKRELKENAVDKYKIAMDGNQTMTVPSMGDQTMGIRSSMTYTIKTGKVDAEKGEAEAEVITSDMEFKLEGPMADMAQAGMSSLPKETKVKGILDQRNRFKVSQGSAINPQMLMMNSAMGSGLGMGIEFPDRAVKIGETWDVVIPKNPMFGNKEVTLKCTLVAETTVDEVPAYEVAMKGDIVLDVDMAELVKAMGDSAGNALGMMQGMRMLLKGTMALSSVGWVERATGRLLKMESEIENKQTMELPDMGISIPASGKSKVVMELVKQAVR